MDENNMGNNNSIENNNDANGFVMVDNPAPQASQEPQEPQTENQNQNQPVQPEPQAPQAAQSMVFLGLCLANLFITAMRTP